MGTWSPLAIVTAALHFVVSEFNGQNGVSGKSNLQLSGTGLDMKWGFYGFNGQSGLDFELNSEATVSPASVSGRLTPSPPQAIKLHHVVSHHNAVDGLRLGVTGNTQFGPLLDVLGGSYSFNRGDGFRLIADSGVVQNGSSNFTYVTAVNNSGNGAYLEVSSVGTAAVSTAGNFRITESNFSANEVDGIHAENLNAIYLQQTVGNGNGDNGLELIGAQTADYATSNFVGNIGMNIRIA